MSHDEDFELANDLKNEFSRAILEILIPNPANLLSSNSTWLPPTDVWENEKEIFIQIEIAGVSEDDIKLILEDRKLIVSGIRKEKVANNLKTKVHQIEIGYGYFERAIELSVRVNKQQINAKYKNGFLGITIQKLKFKSYKEIEIKVEN